MNILQQLCALSVPLLSVIALALIIVCVIAVVAIIHACHRFGRLRIRFLFELKSRDGAPPPSANPNP